MICRMLEKRNSFTDIKYSFNPGIIKTIKYSVICLKINNKTNSKLVFVRDCERLGSRQILRIGIDQYGT